MAIDIAQKDAYIPSYRQSLPRNAHADVYEDELQDGCDQVSYAGADGADNAHDCDDDDDDAPELVRDPQLVLVAGA